MTTLKSYLLAPEMANNAIHLSRHLKPLKLPIASCGQVIAGVGPSRCAADSTARVYDQAFNISSFIVIIAGQSALHVCRLIISYTLWEVMKTMEQAFLPIIDANRKGNLKSGRIYLL
jgi:hypothetical protein